VNKIYALVWNHSQGCWKVAHEGARRRCKTSRKQVIGGALVLLGLGGWAPAFALPTGGAVVSGSADILSYENGQQMSINQHSDKLITNWTDFSVGAGQRVKFNQPGTSSVALNRVIGNNVSSIKGQLEANGRVFLVNPNGVVFGQGAQVNVGGLVASTQGISDADFLAGKYAFAGHSNAEIVNNGTITAALGGSVALLGSQVRNDGTIKAQMGRVALGAGSGFTLNFDDNNLLDLQVNGAAINALAKNGGLLKADGGQVLMTAKGAGTLLQAVVNNQGAIEAKTLSGKSGRIVLDGIDAGTVRVGGALTASALNSYGNGGVIEVKGSHVETQLGAQVNTQASNGQTGTWRTRSSSISVNPTAAAPAGTAFTDTISRNLSSTHIELVGTEGNVSIGGPITWSSGNRLTLKAATDINLNGALSASGTGAGIALSAGNDLNLNNKISLSGINNSLGLDYGSRSSMGRDAQVTLSGAGAGFNSNGASYTVIQNVAQLQNINANLNGLYVLGNKIAGYGAFKSIGGDAQFSGVFDGLGNTISGLSVTNTGSSVGLFSSSSGSISNVNLLSMSVAGGSSNLGFSSIGGLVGSNFGTISNVTTAGVNVSAGSRSANVLGGLVGSNLGGSVDKASTAGTLTGNSYTHSIGGLVGENVTNAWGVASVANSASAANISGYMQRNMTGGVGGLIGTNNGGHITDSSSQGTSSACYAGLNIGGLIGFNQNGTVERSVSSGAVRGSGASNVGGLVGLNANSSISQSSSSSVVMGAGSLAVGGLVGMNQNSTLSDVKALGKVTDNSGANVGGLVGNNNFGRIDTAEAQGVVVAGNNSRVGGLIGNNYGGEVAHSVARGKTSGGTNSHAGGLVGFNDGNLQSVEASGDVNASSNSFVGGLVGTNGSNIGGTIESASASGSVKGESRSLVGGLVGQNDAQIVNSSASGMVSGGSYVTMGGLVGLNKGNVRQSVASGKINVLSSGYYQTYGGLVGANYGEMLYNGVSGEALLVPLAGINQGVIR